jgi:hypothetical protein
MKRPFHLSDLGKNAKLSIISPPSLAAPTLKTNSSGDPISTQSFVCETNFPAVKDYDSQELISLDTEVNLSSLGKFTDNATRAYLDSKGGAEGNFQKVQVKQAPNGTELSRKVLQGKAACNINQDVNPVSTIKDVPYTAFISKYTIRRTYQLAHTDGVSFGFLYDLARRLHETKSVALLGYGPKRAPLIFVEGGTPYRCALFGEIVGDTYKLLILISGQELKTPTL